MKRAAKTMLCILMSCILLGGLLAGCGSGGNSGSGQSDDTKETPASGDGAETPSGTEGNKDNQEIGQASGEGADLEHVTLKFIFFDDKKSRTDEVWDAIADYVADTLNASFDVQFVAGTDYEDKLTVKAATGESWDMNFDSNWTGYFKRVEKGAYMALDDLLPEYAPDLYQTYLESGAIEAAKYQGQIMALPWTMTMNNRPYFQWRGDLAEAAGIDVDKDNLNTYEDVDELLTQLKEAYPDKYITEVAAFLEAEGNWVDIEHQFLMDLTDDSCTVVGKEYTDTYKLTAYYGKKWQDEGIIWKDVLTDNQDHNALIDQGKLITKFGTHEFAHSNRAWAEDGAYWDFTEIYEEGYYANRTPLANALAISATSEHPERTLMFLNMIETDQQLYDMVHYGIMGETYELDGEAAVYPDGMDSSNSSYMDWGGRWALWKPQFMRPDSTYGEGFWAAEAEYAASKPQNVVSPLEGFSFDAADVKVELAQRDQIFYDANKLIEVGLAGDPDEAVAKLIRDLEAAGTEKILAEYQRQVDEFLANK